MYHQSFKLSNQNESSLNATLPVLYQATMFFMDCIILAEYFSYNPKFLQSFEVFSVINY